MNEFDPLKPDSYAKHLSDLNKTKNVVTSENIYNQKGALLVKSGESLAPGVTEKLIKHRLMKPLQDSVHIKDGYNGEKLYNHISEWIKNHDDLMAIHTQNQIDRPLKAMCNLYAKHKTLQQMLTVLASQIPKAFEKGCFCAWLSIGISQKLQLPPSEASAIFIAALCHDIGLLHIPPEIVNKTGQYDSKEWRTMQNHTVIGHAITKSISGIHKIIPRAILEHHESCDGTGYPAGRIEERLIPAGQIIAICDTLHPLRFKGSKESTNLKCLQPFLQINQRMYMYKNYTAIASLINKAELTVKRRKSDEEMPDYCQRLLSEYDLLTAWARSINDIMACIPTNTAEKPRQCAQKIYLHILYIVKSSGLFNLGIKRWIQHGLETASSEMFSEIEEIGLMYTELLWQMKKLYRQLTLINDESKHLGDNSLNESMDILAQLSQEKIPPSLQDDHFDLEQII